MSPRPGIPSPTRPGAGRVIDLHGPNGLPPTVTLSRGDQVSVHLVENASTGYTWAATATSNLPPTADSVTPPATPIPGAAGVHTFTYRAITAGQGTLTFTLRRPWEPSPLKTLTVAVTIAG